MNFFVVVVLAVVAVSLAHDAGIQIPHIEGVSDANIQKAVDLFTKENPQTEEAAKALGEKFLAELPPSEEAAARAYIKKMEDAQKDDAAAGGPAATLH